MIAKGNLHAHGVKLAAYLTTGKDDERAELAELRGFVADTIRDAFIDVQIQAEGTKAEKPFFHAYVRLPADETLTREQWQHVADRMEKRLGFGGQGRAIAFHYKQDGETHMHVAWSRIDLETMTAIDPGLYKNKMKELCREFEKEFGLTLVTNERDPADKTKAAGRNEFEQSRRLGTNLKDIRTTILECWQSADTGRAFVAALDQHGLILARGDKRDFVVIDHDGGDHALSKRITGATAAETRARLSDLDRAALPSVEQAKAAQRDRTGDVQIPRVEDITTKKLATKPAQAREERQIAQAERMAAWETFADRQANKTGDPLAKAESTLAATGRPAAALASSAVNVVIKTADLMLDSVMGFFTPPTEEQQRDMAREEAQRIARAADAAPDERAESPPPPPSAKDQSIARPYDEDRDDDDHDYDFERERTWR